MSGLTYQGVAGIIRNSRDKVVNLRGELGNPTQTAAISVTDAGTSTQISSNKRTMVVFNTGSSDCYFGASGVTSTTGGVIYGGTAFTFENVKDDFIVYFIMSAGETTTLRKVEF